MNRLLAKHKNAENNLADLGRGLDQLQQQGQQLVDEQIPGSGPVPLRLAAGVWRAARMWLLLRPFAARRAA